jgi:(p)ppGpp synthase/HD superfamily hydrolase
MTARKGQMLDKMLVLATNAHAGQFDKGGNPYILHPLAVMNFLNTDDEELQCIALGHDLFEDTSTTAKRLWDIGMTERVVYGIKFLTKMPGETYEEYKERVFSNRDAMLVKMQDLRHNSDIRRLKGVEEKDIARVVKYHKFFLEIKERLG